MTFEVGVKLQTGERFEIEANSDETVADLKNRIEVSELFKVKIRDLEIASFMALVSYL